MEGVIKGMAVGLPQRFWAFILFFSSWRWDMFSLLSTSSSSSSCVGVNVSISTRIRSDERTLSTTVSFRRRIILDSTIELPIFSWLSGDEYLLIFQWSATATATATPGNECTLSMLSETLQAQG